jgi:hypothetical protein
VMPEVGLEPTQGCPHRILSPPCSGTGADTEGHKETKRRFYRALALSLTKACAMVG